MARRTRRTLAALVVLLATAAQSHAETVAVRIRWRPPTGRVAGYLIYHARVGTTFPAPVDVGLPATATDGTISYRLSGILTGVDHVFAVAAYTSDRRRSTLSNYGFFHQPGGCQTVADCTPIDACSSASCVQGACSFTPRANGTTCGAATACAAAALCQAGHCAPGAPRSCDDHDPCTDDACTDPGGCTHRPRATCAPCAVDSDCADADACTLDERCRDGTCTSDVRTCTPSGPCTIASCDATSGCIEEPAPDGTSCSPDDVCHLDHCAAGQCIRGGSRSDLDLDVQRLVVRRTRRTTRLVARATTGAPLPRDPADAGLELVLEDRTGTPVLVTQVGAADLLRRGRRRVLRLGTAGASGTAGHPSLVRRLTLEVGKHGMTIRLEATLPAGALPTDLVWHVRQDAVCASRDLACTATAAVARCRGTPDAPSTAAQLR
ncbi:MAG: hypothetical protein U0807_16475 [Candidatus Binatia bacterium]